MSKIDDVLLKQLRNDMMQSLTSALRLAINSGALNGRKAKKKTGYRWKAGDVQPICLITGNNGDRKVLINNDKIGRNLDEYIDLALSQGWPEMSELFRVEILVPIRDGANRKGYRNASDALHRKGLIYISKISQVLIEE
jgi:hypothetical protein